MTGNDDLPQSNKQNKGKNGGGTVAGGANEASNIQRDPDPQFHPSFRHHGPYIPPYPGSQPTYFSPPGPMYPPFASVQSQDNNGLFELVQEMNNRLKIIETNVTKIVSIEKDVSHLKREVCKIQETNKALSSRITDLESFCETYSEVTDDYISTKRKFQDEITTVKSNIQRLHNENNFNTQKCLDTQVRYMENQLIIFGVDEVRPANPDDRATNNPSNRENTEQVFREFLKDNIENNPQINTECPITVDGIQFDKVVRLGNASQRSPDDRPRPIMARFERFTTREKVKRAGAILNKAQKKYKIYEHFPREIEERRKALYPIARYYGDMGHKVNLVRDRLYINNKLYNPDNGRLEQNTAPRPRTDYVNRINRLQHPPSYHSDETQRQITQQSAGFETPNRFAALADNADTTNKRKAHSPLDLETAPKRIDTEMSPMIAEHAETDESVDPHAEPQPEENDTQGH